MADSFLDNVKELMILGVGDDDILIQIRRAAEAGEVISAYEREYIEDLVKEHLTKPEPEPQKPKPPAESEMESSMQKPDSVPAEPPKPESQKTVPDHISQVAESKTEQPETMTRTFADHRSGTASFQIIPQSGSFFQRYKFLIIGGAAAVAIILGIVMFAGMDTSDRSTVTSPINSADLENTLNLDESSYAQGDLASVYGTSTADAVSIEVTDQSNRVVWKDTSNVRSDGTYSNMFIVGGSDWIDQEYFITAMHDTEEVMLTFDFAN